MEELIFFILTTGVNNSIYVFLFLTLAYIIIYQSIKHNKIMLINIKDNVPIIYLAIFGITYSIFGGFLIESTSYLLTPIMVYVLGGCIGYINRKKIDDKIISICYASMIGFAIHVFLNYVSNIGNQRFELTDFYSKSIQAATGSGMLNTFVFSIFFCVLLLEKRIKYKLIGIICFVISLLYSFLLGTRTQFIVLAVTFMVSYLLLLYETKKIKKISKLLLSSFVIIAIIFVAYKYDLFSIATNFQESNLMYRLTEDIKYTGSSDLSRKSRLINGFFNLFKYPFGVDSYMPYYHNLWLDVGRIAGIIPTLFLFGYTVVTYVHMIKIFINKKIAITVRYTILTIYLGFFINFFVEPVLEGMIEFFWLFCMFNGLVEYYYRNFRSQNI